MGVALPFPGGPPPERPRLRSARYLVLHLPAFRLERCGYEADEVAALTAEQKSAVRLVALTPAARAEGLWTGMTASEARARLPEVQLEPLDPEGEHEDRRSLAERFRRLSDRVVPLWDDEIGLEIGGTAHLFGGEAGILAEARALGEGFGHVVSAAVSDDWLAAGALAAWGDGDTIAPCGEGARALAPLPLSALRPSRTLREALATVGIERVGEWARLDPASVAGRFGEEGRRLHRVARGQVASGRLPWSPEQEPILEEVALGCEVDTLQPVLFVLQGLLGDLSRSLAGRDALAVRLALRLELERGPACMVRMRVGRPTRDPDTLLRVLSARLEGLTLQAPATALSLEVEEHCPEVGAQPGLTDRTQAVEAWADLQARLVDALGEESLLVAELEDRWRPEGAWSPRPLVRPRAAPACAPRRKIDPVEVLRRWERDLPRPRPTLLLPRPRPIDVRERQGRPVAVRLERGWQEVRRAEGPERLQGEWWGEDGGFDRSYWVVDVGEGVGWLFQEDARWYWHGWFD